MVCIRGIGSAFFHRRGFGGLRFDRPSNPPQHFQSSVRGGGPPSLRHSRSFVFSAVIALPVNQLMRFNGDHVSQ